MLLSYFPLYLSANSNSCTHVHEDKGNNLANDNYLFNLRCSI
jgi:hypothetical protein